MPNSAEARAEPAAARVLPRSRRRGLLPARRPALTRLSAVALAADPRARARARRRADRAPAARHPPDGRRQGLPARGARRRAGLAARRARRPRSARARPRRARDRDGHVALGRHPAGLDPAAARGAARDRRAPAGVHAPRRPGRRRAQRRRRHRHRPAPAALGRARGVARLRAVRRRAGPARSALGRARRRWSSPRSPTATGCSSRPGTASPT